MGSRPVEFSDGRWLNEPPVHRLTPERLEIGCAKGSDLWQHTHYGFSHVSGHALLVDAPAAFVAEIDVAARFTGKYEQAGLLLWQDDRTWAKFGIEYADGRPNFAAVVTRGRSDWSMAPAAPDIAGFKLRMTRTDAAIILHYRSRRSWQILRVAGFPPGAAEIGPMACSPQTEGFTAAFAAFTLGPVPEDPLYIGASA
ncbi:DUF1349 domain-containing protein [Tropicimonas sp.]|uniref:DUF1349 domain-containing protein n=1 Tax=Tropicimonas sp. TaxID=2067044 RepID=UPI003A868D39